MSKATTQPIDTFTDTVCKTGLTHLYQIDPLKLARINFSLFSSLCGLGTSPGKICRVLQINQAEYRYLRELASH